MELYEALQTRRTIHRYRQDPLPEGAIERALEAAILAPNHRLTWPWRFLRVGRETREPIAALACKLKEKPGQPCTGELLDKVRGKILNPAELIVVSVVRRDGQDATAAREDYAATACAIQNLTLALTAEGVGTKWSSGKITTHAETYQRLGIDPDAEEIIGFIWAGIAANAPTIPARPALEEFVRVLP